MGRVRSNGNFLRLVYVREKKRWEIQSYGPTFYNRPILGGNEEKDFNQKSRSDIFDFSCSIITFSLGMATGRVRAGFLYTRTRPAGLNLLSEPGPFNKRVFFVAPKLAPSKLVSPSPKSKTKKLVQTQNHKSSQNNIFLASKWMPRSNKPICIKNPTNPRNFANPEIKLANLKIPPTKKKNAHKFGSQKQNPNPDFAHTNTKRKKPKPKPIRLWVCNKWGVVHGGWEFRDGG